MFTKEAGMVQNYWIHNGILVSKLLVRFSKRKEDNKKKYNTWSELEKELYISLNQYLVHVNKVYADLEDKAVTS